jgi:hypothetical protein
MHTQNCLSLLLSVAVGLSPTTLLAQVVAPKSAAPKTKSASAAPRSPVGAPIRRLAKGVETTIPIDPQASETFSSHFPRTPHNRAVVELLRGKPEFDLKYTYYPKSATLQGINRQTGRLEGIAANTAYRRQVWNLEFTFKPLRMMWVDIPQPSGKMAKKLVWYLVFRVKNSGDHLEAVRDTEGSGPTLAEWNAGDKAFKKSAIAAGTAYKDAFKIKKFDDQVWFIPRFVLESEEYDKAYLDRLIPVAIPAIQLREDRKRRLLSTVEISSLKIPLSKGREDNSVWGVATWVDVDPRMDRFSIYIEGLTNAYRWQDRNKTVRPLDREKIVLRDAEDKPVRKPLRAERVMRRKTLRLRFWRPGDEFYQSEREIRYGAPPSKGKGTLDHEWVWR